MDFWSSVKILLRRWYVVTAGVLITAAAAVAVSGAMTPTYTASGSLLLIVPPTVPTRPAGANPYYAYGDLNVLANVTARILNRESSKEALKALGATGKYVVELDADRSSPIISVVGTGHTPKEATSTVDVAMKAVQESVQRRQETAGADPASLILADTIAGPDKAIQDIGSKLRAVSAIMVIGLVSSISAAFLAENVAQHRKEERLDDEPPFAETAPEGRHVAREQPVGQESREAASARAACPLCDAVFDSVPVFADHLERHHRLSAVVTAPRR